MKKETFTLTEDHITLLRSMYVGWQDCETGAPEIDPKRPYGNSDVDGDVIKLLDWFDIDSLPEEEQDDVYETDEYEELCKRAEKIHSETVTALQIILYTGEFETGDYVNKEDYGIDWVKVT